MMPDQPAISTMMGVVGGRKMDDDTVQLPTIAIVASNDSFAAAPYPAQETRSGFSTAPIKNTAMEVSSLIMKMKGWSATKLGLGLGLKELRTRKTAAGMEAASVPSSLTSTNVFCRMSET